MVVSSSFKKMQTMKIKLTPEVKYLVYSLEAVINKKLNLFFSYGEKQNKKNETNFQEVEVVGEQGWNIYFDIKSEDICRCALSNDFGEEDAFVGMTFNNSSSLDSQLSCYSDSCDFDEVALKSKVEPITWEKKQTYQEFGMSLAKDLAPYFQAANKLFLSVESKNK